MEVMPHQFGPLILRIFAGLVALGIAIGFVAGHHPCFV